MSPTSPEKQPSIRPPHPLAEALIGHLRERSGSIVLEFCTGSGRNVAALRAAGVTVVGIEDRVAAERRKLPALRGPFDAVLSTHGLLHDDAETIGLRVAELAGLLGREGYFYAVFGSVRDARFGRGTRIAARTFAPEDGDERGVAHTYFTRGEIEALLAPHVHPESIEERIADADAGDWAHRQRPLTNAVHWFVRARRREK